MKINSILLAFLIIPFLSFSQQSENFQLTLSKAREIAINNHPEIKARKIEEKINTEFTAETKLKRIPQVNGDFNIQRNLIIPVTPVPANAFNPSAPAGELLPLRFTTKWTANSGLSANVDLFNPQKKQAVQEAVIKEEITKIENENYINLVNFEVGNAYIAALISSEQLRLAVADTSTQANLLKLSYQQFNEGRLLLTSLNQIKAAKNNALNNWEEAAKIYENTKNNLLFNMGYDPNLKIEITFLDNLEDLFFSFQTKQENQLFNTYASNKFKQNEALLKSKIKATMNGYLPSLTLRGYYGANYFDNNFEIFKSQNWNGNSFINLGLKLPLTEGFEKQKKINQLNLQIKADQLRFENEMNKSSLELQNAKREAQVLEKNYIRSKENFKLATENLAIAEQQFANGRLLLSELNTVNFNYQKEKNVYLNIAYNYISAKLIVEKITK